MRQYGVSGRWRAGRTAAGRRGYAPAARRASRTIRADARCVASTSNGRERGRVLGRRERCRRRRSPAGLGAARRAHRPFAGRLHRDRRPPRGSIRRARIRPGAAQRKRGVHQRRRDRAVRARRRSSRCSTGDRRWHVGVGSRRVSRRRWQRRRATSTRSGWAATTRRRPCAPACSAVGSRRTRAARSRCRSCRPNHRRSIAPRSACPTDAFVFLFAFSFHSVVERKDPFALIEAFRTAFEPGEGPVLVIKSIHGDHQPARTRTVARPRAVAPTSSFATASFPATSTPDSYTRATHTYRCTAPKVSA